MFRGLHKHRNSNNILMQYRLIIMIKKAKKNMHIKQVTQPIYNSWRSYNRNKGKQKKKSHTESKIKTRTQISGDFFAGLNDY